MNVSLPIVVLLCGSAAALVAFALSVSRRIEIDPLQPAGAEQAVRRSILRHPKLVRFLRERTDRRSAGGYLVTASLVVLFVVSIVVGVVLDMIDDNNALARADRSVASWGSRHGSSTTIDVLRWVTQLGSSVVVVAVLAGVALYEYLRRRKADVVLFMTAIGLGELLLANVLKLVVRRDRPNVLHLVGAHGFSFPSGHTVSAAAAWTAVALVLGRGRHRRVRAALAGGAALISVSVAASRALLGVHWLTDVLAGLAIGWGWFALTAIFFGGRAQRLGDPITARPQGVSADVGTPDGVSSSEPPASR
ncbi:MAG: phosphatase PAP2 family protein [Ilumatobacteraceae bacterium]